MSMGRRIVADSLKGKALKRKASAPLFDGDLLDQLVSVFGNAVETLTDEEQDALLADFADFLANDRTDGSVEDLAEAYRANIGNDVTPYVQTLMAGKSAGAGLKRKSGGDTDFTDEMYKVLAGLGRAMGMADRALTKAVDADMGDISTEADALSAVLNRLDSLEESGQLPSRDDVQEFLDALGDLLNQASSIPAQAGVDLGNAHSQVEDVLSDWDTIEEGAASGGDDSGEMQDPRGTWWGSASAARLKRKASRDGDYVGVRVKPDGRSEEYPDSAALYDAVRGGKIGIRDQVDDAEIDGAVEFIFIDGDGDHEGAVDTLEEYGDVEVFSLPDNEVANLDRALGYKSMGHKSLRTKRSPFTRQERSESGITESLDHVTQCADAASHFWTSGDAEEAMSALDDLIAEAKAAKQKIANHGETYPPEPEEVVEEASARKARIEERSAHARIQTKSEPGTPGFNKEIAYSLGQISERLEGVDSEGQQLVDDARNYFDDLADEMAGD